MSESVIVTLAAETIFGSIANALMVVLGLGLVIFFHELGHFAVAKWCNVHVERFSIGIGPILWSRQKGETEYALSALPLGGYVKMLGQDDMDPSQMTSEEIAENPRAYSSRKVWQRMLIISAGVIMNVITGFGFYAWAFGLGLEELQPVVGSVLSGSPAWEAGLRPGDRIEAINGEEIQSFIDVHQAIVLSTGDLTIQGTTAAGEKFQTAVTPRRGSQMREIGVSPGLSLTISERADKPGVIMLPGLPASRASEPFLPGDTIAALNGTPVRTWPELSEFTARHAADELVYTVERKPPGSVQTAEPVRTDITVPPAAMRSLGFWMHIGAVQSVRRGSVAERQGLLAGDKIVRVDDLEVSRDIDPLRLPNYFAERAGQNVKVTVLRQVGGAAGEETRVLEMVPEDRPGWSELPTTLNTPLSIPAIGAAFRITNRISRILEGSEAASVSVKGEDGPRRLEPGQRIVRVVLPWNEQVGADALGDRRDGRYIIELDKEERPCWAHVFFVCQRAPGRSVRIFIADRSEKEEEFSVLLRADQPEDGWFMPIRGIGGFEQLSAKRVADSPAHAVTLGLRETRRSIVQLYLTLKSLIRRDLSARALSGPVGIISMGYAFADSGAAPLLRFLGLLSINLAVLNFLPIPVLDGGHMMFLIWEGVTRRKPSPKFIGWAHAAGLLFIISLFLFVMYLDVVVRFLGIGAE